jgi:lipid-binding SYLF domain-containing protein
VTAAQQGERHRDLPSTVKAGFVVGGMRGRGVISARGANGWSAPAFLTLTCSAGEIRAMTVNR